MEVTAEKPLIEQVQEHLIEYIVSQSSNQQQACEMLGISPRKLQVWMRRMGYGPRERPKRFNMNLMLHRISLAVWGIPLVHHCKQCDRRWTEFFEIGGEQRGSNPSGNTIPPAGCSSAGEPDTGDEEQVR